MKNKAEPTKEFPENVFLLEYSIVLRREISNDVHFNYVIKTDSYWLISDELLVEDTKNVLQIDRNLAEDVDKAVLVFTTIVKMMDGAFDAGRKIGQAEAQRFFRYALGIEAPDSQIASTWNNPVPLKGY